MSCQADAGMVDCLGFKLQVNCVPAPLRDLKVLDFSNLLPGCYASMLLADLGAQVTKVEAKNRPDLLKEMLPRVGNSSAWYQLLNRNKRVLPLDLKNKDDHALALQQVAACDVVLEGFRPGVMARLGLDYETLRKDKPDLIYCSLSGYGQSGTYAPKAGHDINFLALSAIGSLGSSDALPSLHGVQIADICAGALYAVVAILTAELHRQRTGEGQYIDVAMLDTSIALAAVPLSVYLTTGKLPQPDAELLNGGNPFYQHYQTSDGRWLSMGAIESQFRKTVAATLDLPDDADNKKLQKIIATKIKSKTLAEWQAIFNDKDCCVEPCLNAAELAAHPQCQARQMLVDVPDEQGGTQQQVAHPIKYSTFTPRYAHTGGAHAR